MSERKSQRARVLALLIAAGGAEVPSLELSRISLQYNARLLELRSLGFCIVSRTERHGGVIQGFFHLERGAGMIKQHSQQPPVAQESLFSDLTPESEYPG